MNYTTQMDAAKKGIITSEMEIVAKKEGLDVEVLRERVARGTVAIPANKNHKSLSPEGIGEGLRTKINVNLGISRDAADVEKELEKVRTAINMKAEAIMDLSNYGKTREMRHKIVDMSTAMLGTVPIYDAIGYCEKKLKDISKDDFMRVVRQHAEDGVDFMTIHAGINRATAQKVKDNKRRTNIVSRGGALLFAWMEMTGNENPFFEYYDEVLDILAEYDVTISL
ncbi:MAG: phosphomethylpyrimidine synthase ThiC, partial [Oscillospiraceae bacterium]